MNNSTYIHKYLRNLISRKDTVVDMTLGNGNDAFFLCARAGKVYGFDISETAIARSRERLKDFDNIVFINDDHCNVERYIKEKCRLFIFNLGYLPNSDHSSVTRAESTLPAFRKAYDLLQEGGYLVITFYFSQPGGPSEFSVVDGYIARNKIPVVDMYRQDRYHSPLTYIIRKIS